MLSVAAVTDRRRLGWALAALGMLFVSTDSLWVRLSGTGPLDMAFLVGLFSLPIFLSLNRLVEDRGPRRSLETAWRPLLVVGALAATSHLAFITAITRTDVANVAVIVAASPIITAAMARLVLGERATRRLLVAMMATVVGILVVVGGSVGRPNIDGDLFAVLAIVSFTGSLLIWRRHPELSRYVGLALSSLFVVAVSAPFASPFAQEPRTYLAAAAMGLVFSPAGRIAHSTAPAFAPAAEVALFAPVETVAAPIWVWLAFGEVPTELTVLGGVIIVGAVFYGTLGAVDRDAGATQT